MCLKVLDTGHNVSELVLVRIDDRLIHGQVVVKWLRHLDCNEIVIVDDDVWKDRDLKDVLRLAAPRGVTVRVLPVAQASRAVNGVHSCTPSAEDSCAVSCAGAGFPPSGTPTNCQRRILMLVKTPCTALTLLESGLRFQELNVGGLAGGENTTRVFRSISLTREQLDFLRQIGSRGVRVYFQTVPDERALELSELVVVPARAN
jgi:PTS system mannose-specific IIB component